MSDNKPQELSVREQPPKNEKGRKPKLWTVVFVVCGVIGVTAIAVWLGLYFRESRKTTSNLLEPFAGDSVTWVVEYSITGDINNNVIGNDEEWWESCEYDPSERNNYSPNPVGDISYQTFVNRNPDCDAYAGTYEAVIEDLQEEEEYVSRLIITTDSSTNKCIFESNNIPNHDIGGSTSNGKDFATTVDANKKTFRLEVPRKPSNPRRNAVPTYVKRVGGSLTLNGILLNGVDLDMDSAFCYNEDFPGPTKIALFSRDDPSIRCGTRQEWYAIPAENPSLVTLDEYSGHSYNGRYHYHGDNAALHHHHSEGNVVEATNRVGCSGSPVVGFAPDGFPIYGHYAFGVNDEDGSKNLYKARSSYRIKESFLEDGFRDISGTEPVPPIDEYHPLGIFENDWEYVEGLGDLDECNGMVDYYGNYGYYYTEEYPYGPLCTMGAPDPSFTKPSSDYEREDGNTDSTGGGNGGNVGNGPRPNNGGGNGGNGPRPNSGGGGNGGSVGNGSRPNNGGGNGQRPTNGGNNSNNGN